MDGPSLDHLPPERAVSAEELAAAVAAGARVAVLDDDPTGTQTVRDVPVLTTWGVEDVRWALRQGTVGFFILTNSRSLSEADAAVVNRQAAHACLTAAAAEGRCITFASRSDSTLRGHFPLEVDVLIQVSAEADQPIDGVIVVPAYVDAGRVTVGSVHGVVSGDRLTPVAETEFARDATFGYTQSNLAAWIAEKSGGAIRDQDVARITLEDLRTGGPSRVATTLSGLASGRMVVVDAVTDDDLRVLAVAATHAEASGSRFVYRTGPSFVRARLGQLAHPPVSDEELREVVRRSRSAAGGLVVVGSHVSLTTRQLESLEERVALTQVELDVRGSDDAAHLTSVVRRVVEGLGAGHVVLRTPREVVLGSTPEESLAISRRLSARLAEVVRDVTALVRPAFVVAKGGITSADVATQSLGIRRAWVRGTLLPGVVSLWEPVTDGAVPVPYVVFAGNVGDDDALATVVERLAAGRDEGW